MKQMAIYVVSHKKIDDKFPEGYRTIIVDANVNKVTGDCYDNIGDNISSKNGSYCELTALYWLWKNSKDDYIGIDHYRRFFMNGDNLLSAGKAAEIVKNGTVIVPKIEKFGQNIGTKYWTTSGYKSDLTVIREAISKYSPEYSHDYDVIMNQNKLHCYNMLVMNKEMYDAYCEWLFNVLTIVEAKLDAQHRGADDRNGYYRRVYGFMSERLLNVYLLHNRINIIELPVKFTGQQPNFVNRVRTKLSKLKDKYLR
jgi:hypothetical protein